MQKHDQLTWLPELGIGYYPVKASPYDDAYWDNYVKLDRTKEADRLNEARCNFASNANPLETVDIGIGGGRFVTDFGCYGYDINPNALRWLSERGKWWNPQTLKVDAATFWDSLEHIHDPSKILDNVRKFVFISMPIYKDCEHILRSKHFKKDEHCWYFTRQGLETFMGWHGFKCIARNTMEQPIREDIESFCFERIVGLHGKPRPWDVKELDVING